MRRSRRPQRPRRELRPSGGHLFWPDIAATSSQRQQRREPTGQQTGAKRQRQPKGENHPRPFFTKKDIRTWGPLERRGAKSTPALGDRLRKGRVG